MTLRYARGMSLGEFQDMIAEHQREDDQRQGRRLAVARCDHPFEQAGLGVAARKVDEGVEIQARYQCPACGAKWGVRKLLHYRKATAQT